MLIQDQFIPICSSGTQVFGLFSSLHSLVFTLQLPKSDPLITPISLLCMYESAEAQSAPQIDDIELPCCRLIPVQSATGCSLCLQTSPSLSLASHIELLKSLVFEITQLAGT